MTDPTRRPVLRLEPESCTFDPCTNPVKYGGLCSGHAEQRRRGAELRPLRRRARGVRLPCVFDGCGKVSTAHGYCEGHYEHLRRGRPLAPLRTKRVSGSSGIRDSLGRKHCTGCDEWKPEEAFTKNVRMFDGLTLQCSRCLSVSAVLRRFNITLETYLHLQDEFGGACGICRQPDPRGLALAVDHDHGCCPEAGRSCGKCIRGLLCWGCNTALGVMLDDPGRLRAAADYLEERSSGA